MHVYLLSNGMRLVCVAWPARVARWNKYLDLSETFGKPLSWRRRPRSSANMLENSLQTTFIYCHVSGVITGPGLDDWIYWHLYYSYNQL
jgi:hypothetical protein